MVPTHGACRSQRLVDFKGIFAFFLIQANRNTVGIEVRSMSEEKKGNTCHDVEARQN